MLQPSFQSFHNVFCLPAHVKHTHQWKIRNILAKGWAKGWGRRVGRRAEDGGLGEAGLAGRRAGRRLGGGLGGGRSARLGGKGLRWGLTEKRINAEIITEYWRAEGRSDVGVRSRRRSDSRSKMGPRESIGRCRLRVSGLRAFVLCLWNNYSWETEIFKKNKKPFPL